MSTTSHIVSLLIEERSKIQAAIDALKTMPEPEPHNVPDWVLPKASPAPKKKGMSAAARKRIGEATRARWAAKRASVAESVAPQRKTNSVRIAEAVAPKKRTMSEEGRQRIIAATKARWAAIRAGKAEASAPKKKSARAIVAEAIAPKEDAEFKSKMSIAMAKSWKKRKAAAKKGTK